MITYENAVDFLVSKVPEAGSDSFFADSPTLAYAQFSNFIVKGVLTGNYPLIERSVEVINEVSSSEKDEVIALACEFAITLYDKDKSTYKIFKEKLDPVAKNLFDDTIRLWVNQGKK